MLSVIRRLLLILSALTAIPALAAPISSYPPASALTGTEKVIATQGTATVNITPPLIRDYVTSTITTLPGLTSAPSLTSAPNLSSLPSVTSLPNLSSLPAITTLPNLVSAPSLSSLPSVTSLPNLISAPNLVVSGGGNLVTFIGLGSNIPSTHLASLIAGGATSFFTKGFYTSGDGGGAQYYFNTGSAQPGDQIDADGDRLSLSLSQQLTLEQLGAPATGWIGTASIAGTTLTATATQSGALAAGMTLTEVGGGSGVTAGTKIVSGSGGTWVITPSQTVSSRVMVGNDSYPYAAAAQTLGHHGMLMTGSHWFSRSLILNSNQVRWFGPNGNQDRGYSATLFFPAGYGGLFAGTPNVTINAQGDISYTGNVAFGGGQGFILDNLRIWVGDGNQHALVNNRPCSGDLSPQTPRTRSLTARFSSIRQSLMWRATASKPLARTPTRTATLGCWSQVPDFHAPTITAFSATAIIASRRRTADKRPRLFAAATTSMTL
jgi:hypothetical protein